MNSFLVDYRVGLMWWGVTDWDGLSIFIKSKSFIVIWTFLFAFFSQRVLFTPQHNGLLTTYPPMYSGNIPSPPRVVQKRPAVKKPLNAFMLFMKEMRQTVIEECTLKESAAINQILGRRVCYDWCHTLILLFMKSVKIIQTSNLIGFYNYGLCSLYSACLFIVEYFLDISTNKYYRDYATEGN